jgi:hypothetical protein
MGAQKNPLAAVGQSAGAALICVVWIACGLPAEDFSGDEIGPVGGSQAVPAIDGVAEGVARRHVQVVESSEPPSQGQVWREYDLRPYLTRVRGMAEPQQPVIDWILRETGTDRWLGDTPGMLSFEGDRIRVYHLPEVHDVVTRVTDRFVNPALAKYSVSVRLVTVDNVAWRSMALPLMEAVSVESPGLQAWTLSQENAARLTAQLRTLVAYRLHNSHNVQIAHGQTHSIERWQPRTYPERLQLTPTTYPGYQVAMGQLQEGFSLELSPLATADGRAMEVVIKCHVDQIEKMTPVTIKLPGSNSLIGGAQIQVPQVASWRLYERFRWPSDQVLVITRGLVAMPGLRAEATNPLSSLLTTAPARAEALLILDCRETDAAGRSEGAAAQAARVNYHGRY